jgi:Gp37 protein
MLKEIESALVDRLTDRLRPNGLRLTAFPDKLSELGKPALSGQILIGYKRSTFRTVSVDPFCYEMLLQFDINLQLKDLRSHTGVYPLLDAIRFELAGWFCGSSAQKRPAYWQAEKFDDVDEKIWAYTQSLIIPLVIESGSLPEFEDSTGESFFEQQAEIQVVVGLWRSPSERLSDLTASTKDSEITVEIPIEDGE